MNNPFYLILHLSILILIGKYIYDLKSERKLVIVLVLFGTTCLGYILTRTFQTPLFLNIGIVAGFILSPILFSIHLLKQKGTDKEKIVRRIMLIPTLTILTVYLFNILHLPNYAVIYYMMLGSVLIGVAVIIIKPELKEILPFQVILIFLIIDTLTIFIK